MLSQRIAKQHRTGIVAALELPHEFDRAPVEIGGCREFHAKSSSRDDPFENLRREDFHCDAADSARVNLGGGWRTAMMSVIQDVARFTSPACTHWQKAASAIAR